MLKEAKDIVSVLLTLDLTTVQSRLALVNINQTARFNLLTKVIFPSQIKHHNLTVIATDGNHIEPILVQRIISSPGERFDMVLDVTKNPNISKLRFIHLSINYFMH